MASDLIGSLGLDTRDIEGGLDRISKKFGESARNAEGFNQTILAGAAAALIWARNFLDAYDRMVQFDKALSKLNSTVSSGSAFKTEGGLASSLKEIDNLLGQLQAKTSLSDVVFQKVRKMMGLGDRDKEEAAALNQLLDNREKVLSEIAEKESQKLNIMQLEMIGEEELAKLEKVRLDYSEKIQAAHLQQNAALVDILKYEQLITEEKIKQDAIQQNINELTAQGEKFREEQEKAADEQSKEQADEAAEGMKTYGDAGMQERANRQAAQKKAEDDLRKQVEQNRKASNQRESNLADELARRGNETAADKLRRETQNRERIQDALNEGNTDLADELKKQMDNDNADFDAAEARKTGADRRNERATGRRNERERKAGESRNRDLDDRLNRGARGDKNSELEQRREENERNAKRAAQGHEADHMGKGEPGSQSAGYGQTDRGYLKQIADALAVKT